MYSLGSIGILLKIYACLPMCSVTENMLKFIKMSIELLATYSKMKRDYYLKYC